MLCARCHGADGRGPRDQPQANPKLDLAGARSIREGSVAGVERQIADGKGAMPAFGSKLTPTQLTGIARHTLALLAAHAPSGGPPATAPGAATTDGDGGSR